MLACVSRALKPGRGRFVFEFGGSGNTAWIEAALERAFSREGYGIKTPSFSRPSGNMPDVEAAGFRWEYAQLFARPTPLQGEDGLGNWIRMFLKGPFEALPDPARQAVIRRVEANCGRCSAGTGQWYADYVRLRMKARKL